MRILGSFSYIKKNKILFEIKTLMTNLILHNLIYSILGPDRLAGRPDRTEEQKRKIHGPWTELNLLGPDKSGLIFTSLQFGMV